MTFSAKAIEVSLSPEGVLLPTLQLRYPRFIHAEELTHRMLSTSPEAVHVETVAIPDGFMYDRNLSRNASSSRAIPVPRLIEDIRRDPAEPLFWGKNQSGMQAREELTGTALARAKRVWHLNREACLADALLMHDTGAHKQITNRLIENHGHINVVVSATEWANFFALRRHEDAQPEIRALADAAFEAIEGAIPNRLAYGEWHLPYVLPHELEQHGGRTDPGGVLRKVSVARCARVSYLTHDGRASRIEEDVALYERLVGSMPLHASPAEHAAVPTRSHAASGNFRGYLQLRKILPGENIQSLHTPVSAVTAL